MRVLSWIIALLERLLHGAQTQWETARHDVVRRETAHRELVHSHTPYDDAPAEWVQRATPLPPPDWIEKVAAGAPHALPQLLKQVDPRYVEAVLHDHPALEVVRTAAYESARPAAPRLVETETRLPHERAHRFRLQRARRLFERKPRRIEGVPPTAHTSDMRTRPLPPTLPHDEPPAHEAHPAQDVLPVRIVARAVIRESVPVRSVETHPSPDRARPHDDTDPLADHEVPRPRRVDSAPPSEHDVPRPRIVTSTPPQSIPNAPHQTRPHRRPPLIVRESTSTRRIAEPRSIETDGQAVDHAPRSMDTRPADGSTSGDVVRTNAETIRTSTAIVRTNAETIRTSTAIVRTNAEIVRTHAETVRAAPYPVETETRIASRLTPPYTPDPIHVEGAEGRWASLLDTETDDVRAQSRSHPAQQRRDRIDHEQRGDSWNE
ncbi:MAG: hypothetical protein SF162_11720 [bacterium]|nr:hypothetical protein [bacterium]